MESYELSEAVFYLEKIVIHPLYQGKQSIDHLFRCAKEQGKACGKMVYFDCCSGNHKLTEYYSRKAE
ncbi:hypothetical protein IW492_14310 [Enterococcus sp. BWB1-3]|uniref:hypothetical protein n=1 Tax=unclassified Enterococcus TaxID=2608891 RepID=UPI001920F44E|nr:MULTISPECIES: hypothetical protein [unclassified Enterococcus]MBL1230404.1 hypothetical protein [Enterococcus sp. BWB1-3]MCB5956466.1 hypothetical protein [Enterococcus sp. CWB-B31]